MFGCKGVQQSAHLEAQQALKGIGQCQLQHRFVTSQPRLHLSNAHACTYKRVHVWAFICICMRKGMGKRAHCMRLVANTYIVPTFETAHP